MEFKPIHIHSYDLANWFIAMLKAKNQHNIINNIDDGYLLDKI